MKQWLKAKKLPKVSLTKKQLRAIAVDQVYFFLGNVCWAAAIQVFVVPNKIAQGGISGLALIANHFFNTPIGVNNLALNIPLVVLALIFLGWKFVAKTLFLIVQVSVVLDLLPLVLKYTYAEDPLLAALFGGVLSGFGQALVLTRGASAGGMEIVGALVSKRWPQIPFGRALMAASVSVVLLGALAFGQINSALYAAVMIFINARIIDGMLYGMNNGKMFYIFTGKAEEIAQAIIAQISRGASIIPAKGAFTGEQQNMLMCVIRRNEVSRLRRLVKEHDPNSFMVIAEAQEIFGQGFGRGV